jgi:hypothetical protein
MVLPARSVLRDPFASDSIDRRSRENCRYLECELPGHYWRARAGPAGRRLLPSDLPLLLITHALAFRILLQHQSESPMREAGPSSIRVEPNSQNS